MSSIILVNDLLDELREENAKLKQTIDLMAKYRICLIDFKDNCNCDKNLSNKCLVDFLEGKWSQLMDNDCHRRSHPPPSQPSISRPLVVQTEPEECHQSSSDGQHMTINIETIGSDTSVDQMDDNTNDEDLDVSNESESDNEDWGPTAGLSNKLRSTTAGSGRSTSRVKDSIGNHKKVWTRSQTGCDQSFASYESLNGHVNSNHPKCQPFACTLCPHVYQTSRHLSKHYNSCHHKSPDKPRLKRQQLIQENKVSFNCLITGCMYRPNTSQGLRRHLIQVHGFEVIQRVGH